jgi:hypothetical protein
MWLLLALPAALAGAVALDSMDSRETPPPPTRIASIGHAHAQSDAAGANRASQVLTVDSGPVEPAVPLKLSLRVKVCVPARTIEITATLGKRPGFPAHLFSDRNVTARITLPPGLQFQTGDLAWSGDLKGDQIARFVATVGVLDDTEGVVEAAAIGHAAGGRVDADAVRFHVVARGGHIRVGLEPLAAPERGSDSVVPRR